MDNHPKHTSHSTKRFIILNNINHFETPPQSPNLIPIEMVIANYFSDRYQSVKYDKKMSPLLKILLGVPHGSVLGPLFFLIMINDLAFIIDLLCKLFADDTTLGDADKDLNTLINRFVEKLKVLLTYFMFVTNKRVKLPKEINLGTKTVNNKPCRY